MLLYFTGKYPLISTCSSVNVPVLSKIIKFIEPKVVIDSLDTEYISKRFNLAKLWVIQIFTQPANEIGIAVVKLSKKNKIIFFVSNSYINFDKGIKKEIIVKISIINIYFIESFSNFVNSYLGFNIPPINLPFNVLNPVSYTIPKIFWFFKDLFSTIFVPAYKKYFSDLLLLVSKIFSFPFIPFLTTGEVSPVIKDSLTITLPLISIVSQGSDKPSPGISYKSPGTNSVEFISLGKISSFFPFL